MSLDQSVLRVERVQDYEPQRAAWIALRYASGEPGTGLSELHRADPDVVPAAMILRRWRQTWPAFDALMIEAERDRADALMEATLAIADDRGRDAASAKNSMAARWRMAEALAPERYRARGQGDGDTVGVTVTLTDAQLERLARGEDASLVLSGPPTAPPLCVSDGATGGDEGERLCQSFPPPYVGSVDLESTEAPLKKFFAAAGSSGGGE